MNPKRKHLRYRGKDPLRQRLAILHSRRNDIEEVIRSLERYRRSSALDGRLDTRPTGA